uniref:Uncharacterized protein LOC104243410 n=1 Tax=Nicotiana sylvestris TaxID=4096 RepID=A0A1U7YDK9_NICSY|nr:PREDICTED: uncharacterized protein LOC104243410 [Nicotiana sylvestris]
MAEDSELWNIIYDSPYVPTKVLEELLFSMEKTSKEYTNVDNKAMEKNFRPKKILVYGIGPEEYNRITACDTAKEIWEALQTAHEGTTQVNAITESKDLHELTKEELVKNLKTHEMKRKIDNEKREPKKEKEPGSCNMGDSSSESEDESNAGDSSIMAVKV